MWGLSKNHFCVFDWYWCHRIFRLDDPMQTKRSVEKPKRVLVVQHQKEWLVRSNECSLEMSKFPCAHICWDKLVKINRFEMWRETFCLVSKLVRFLDRIEFVRLIRGFVLLVILKVTLTRLIICHQFDGPEIINIDLSLGSQNWYELVFRRVRWLAGDIDDRIRGILELKGNQVVVVRVS